MPVSIISASMATKMQVQGSQRSRLVRIVSSTSTAAGCGLVHRDLIRQGLMAYASIRPSPDTQKMCLALGRIGMYAVSLTRFRLEYRLFPHSFREPMLLAWLSLKTTLRRLICQWLDLARHGLFSMMT